MISKIFDISSRSLSVYRRALEVTSHNIANANNPAFSRQRVLFEADISDLNSGIVWGNGIKIGDVVRVKDFLVEAHLRESNSKYYDNSRQGQLINNIESFFSEPGDQGLSNLFSEFFNSFDELASSPNSLSLRNSVINSARNISAKLSSINSSFERLKSDIKNEFNNQVQEINTLLQQIHQVNKELFSNNYKGLAVNDLLDKRDDLISQLSQIVNINVTIDKNNLATISIGGALAVDGLHSAEFVAVEENGQIELQLKNSNIPIILNGGNLNALAQVYSNKIPEYKKNLDSLINAFVDSLNQIHSQGYTITVPPQTGINFFESYSNGQLTINEEIINNPSMIAVSSNGDSGNGDLALQIAGLRDSQIVNGSTLIDAYSTLVNKIANDSVLQNNYAQANFLVLSQLEDQKNSISGVSIDEEMTNVLKFQRSYEASAKLITVADEMIKTILEMV
ncbi:flagellar hook-associated protein FlgK [Ignavibacterium sp.]|uniref:flagellar hook-associated protein FlgK n=1 Tax=Ignavibacterium sp. TaxID=2651167 RepID=UPI00307E41A3